MLRLTLILHNNDLSWVSFLDSEGIPWKTTEETGNKATVRILSAKSSKLDKEYAEKTLLHGGSVVLEDGAFLAGVSEHGETIRLPYDSRYFIGVSDDAKYETIKFKIVKHLNGIVIRLPFKLKSVWNNNRSERRRINISGSEEFLIWENLPFFNKKNIRRIILEAIKIAFHSAGLPFAQKWYWPKDNRSVFCFRGDMDAGNTESMLRFIDAVRPWKNSLTLFACGSAYEGKRALLEKASKAASEIGNHTFSHYVYSSLRRNRINLELTERMLSEFGVAPNGYVGPASFWHPSMYDVLQDKGYKYTSSFGLDHENYPYFPVRNSKEMYDLVELPFHCLGDRFPKFGIKLDSPEVFDFFDQLIDKKYNAGEPIAIYGHPDMEGRMGDYPELVKRICERATSFSDVWTGNMGELAQWWRLRNSVKAEIAFDAASGVLSARNINDETDIYWSIHTPDGRWFLEKSSRLKEGFLPDALTPQDPLIPPSPTDVGEIIHSPNSRNLVSMYRAWRLAFRRKVVKARELKAAQMRLGR